MGINFRKEFDDRISAVLDTKAVTLSDSAVFKMEAPNAPEEYQAERYCRGFYSNVAGTLAYNDPDSSTSHTLAVVAGAYYAMAIGKFLVTGTDAGLASTIFAKR
jgi:hypothetical protein